MRIVFRLLMCGVLIMALLTSCGSKPKVVTSKKQDRNNTTVVKKPIEKEEEKKEDSQVVIDASEREKPVFKDKVEAYIFQFKDVAMTEMQLYKIPASITLAQGILESASGKGRLAVEANNHFGIKCHTSWKGDRIYHDDDELQECFRKYIDASYSYRDHSLFLTQRNRYSSLFNLKPDDYKGWARGLRKAGYATDKKYPQKLISLIERYNLYKYDALVLGTAPNFDKEVSDEITSHVVKPGDTLYSLSRRYGLTVSELKEINNLTTDVLSIGQTLKISKN